MANSVDLDQTAPLGAICSGSTLFASILNSSFMLGKYLQRQHFQMHFFLGALWVNLVIEEHSDSVLDLDQRVNCLSFTGGTVLSSA